MSLFVVFSYVCRDTVCKFVGETFDLHTQKNAGTYSEISSSWCYWPKVLFIFDACCVISIQCVKYSPLIEVHESSFPLITDMLNNTQTSHSIIIRVVVLEYRCTLNNIAYYQSQMCLPTFQLTTLWVQDFYFLVCKITHVSCINNVTTLKIN